MRSVQIELFYVAELGLGHRWFEFIFTEHRLRANSEAGLTVYFGNLSCGIRQVQAKPRFTDGFDKSHFGESR